MEKRKQADWSKSVRLAEISFLGYKDQKPEPSQGLI